MKNSFLPYVIGDNVLTPHFIYMCVCVCINMMLVSHVENFIHRFKGHVTFSFTR